VYYDKSTKKIFDLEFTLRNQITDYNAARPKISSPILVKKVKTGAKKFEVRVKTSLNWRNGENGNEKVTFLAIMYSFSLFFQCDQK